MKGEFEMDRQQIEQAKKQIEFARTWLNRNKLDHYDPHMANYVLRDTQVVELSGLKELSWAMHKEGFCVHDDVLYLIEEVGKYMLSQSAKLAPREELENE